jgi:sRNA-binding carbon storage regulator CsrA
MLTLTRKKNQSIIITTPSGDKLTIHVVKTTQGLTSLALDLPSRNYIVDRGEIHDYFENKRKLAKEELNGKAISEA